MEPVAALTGEVQQAPPRALDGALGAAQRVLREFHDAHQGLARGREIACRHLRLGKLLQRPAGHAVARHVLPRDRERVLPLPAPGQGPGQAAPGVLVARAVLESVADGGGHLRHIALLLGRLAPGHGLLVRVGIVGLGLSERGRREHQ